MKTRSPLLWITIRSARARGGFSLLELMFAIGILGIALVALAAMFPLAIMQQKKASDDIDGVLFGNNLSALLVLDSSVGVPVTPNYTPIPHANLNGEIRGKIDGDPTFGARVAFRRLTASGPVEYAFFIYRKNGIYGNALTTTTVTMESTFATPNPPMDEIVGGGSDVNRRAQCVLIQTSDPANHNVVVGEVTGSRVVSGAERAKVIPIPYNPSDPAYDEVLHIPDKAVAIVLGRLE
jgi:prepilin-type N-terminal cleavage/methylation domain-containing protein